MKKVQFRDKNKSPNNTKMASFNQGHDPFADIANQFSLLKMATPNGQVPSSEAPDDQDEGGGLSLMERLKQHLAKEDADATAQRQEEDAHRNLVNSYLQPKSRFNYSRVSKKIREHTKSLPIYSKKDELIKLVRENQVVIVMGETGSGKSTQIPQYLVEAGFCDSGGIIGVTQPRRVAAKALADRVAREGGVKVGELVGYAVRFDKCLSGATLVKFLTDGLLVKESTTEPSLFGYSVIIIDEAHERSVNTDVCFGLLKRAALQRPDLRIIISSATLDQDRFSKYFNNAPVFKVEGKMHQVDIIYNPVIVANAIETVVSTILQIHANEEDGDILAFLSGQEEIENVWEKLEMSNHYRFAKEMLILPCYGGLPFEEQQLIFDETPPNTRKIVLATNIAETSITIEGIVFVIDSGYFKQNHYNPYTKIDSLVRKPITKFQAIQRMGRAGRTRPGKCYRLYTRSEFACFRESPEPDIVRCNVESVLLDLMAMGIADPLRFDFMDSPPQDAMLEALVHLQELTALDDNMNITPLGKTMSSFPLDPPLSRVLIESANLSCSDQVIKIVAMLSSQHQNLFYRGKKVRAKANQMKALFNQPEGDYLTLLKVYNAWDANQKSKDWCKRNYIQHKVIEEAEEIRVQLLETYLRHRFILSTSRSDDPRTKTNIRKAFTAGYFRQVARKVAFGYAYQALSGKGTSQEVFLHPSSALFPIKPAHPWLIFHEVMVTTKAYMRGATMIELEWIRLYAPKFANRLKSHHFINV